MFFTKKNKSGTTKDTVGATARISLPDFGIKNLLARVDTGAKISALHAGNIHYRVIDGKKMVVFDIIVGKRDEFVSVPAKAELREVRRVVSSNGHITARPVIITRFKVGKRVWRGPLSLIDRSSMRYRMLLGRQALKGRFIVEV